MFSVPSQPGENLGKVCENSQAGKPSTASRIFTDLLSNSPKRLPGFFLGYERMENMFYFLTDDKYSAMMVMLVMMIM